MNLDHWIESLFPLTLDTDWDDFFAKPSNPFSAELLEKLKAFLEEIHSISGINNCLEECFFYRPAEIVAPDLFFLIVSTLFCILNFIPCFFKIFINSDEISLSIPGVI